MPSTLTIPDKWDRPIPIIAVNKYPLFPGFTKLVHVNLYTLCYYILLLLIYFLILQCMDQFDQFELLSEQWHVKLQKM
jgi:hypothetical protein